MHRPFHLLRVRGVVAYKTQTNTVIRTLAPFSVIRGIKPDAASGNSWRHDGAKSIQQVPRLYSSSPNNTVSHACTKYIYLVRLTCRSPVDEQQARMQHNNPSRTVNWNDTPCPYIPAFTPTLPLMLTHTKHKKTDSTYWVSRKAFCKNEHISNIVLVNVWRANLASVCK